MVYKVLNILKQKLNDPLVELSGPSKDKHSLSLIFIEEKNTFRDLPVLKTDTPEIRLNLYILISAYTVNYENALKFISKVISYFHANPVFADENITIELFTPTFEQHFQIWGTLKEAYRPSVMYKVRVAQAETE